MKLSTLSAFSLSLFSTSVLSAAMTTTCYPNQGGGLTCYLDSTGGGGGGLSYSYRYYNDYKAYVNNIINNPRPTETSSSNIEYAAETMLDKTNLSGETVADIVSSVSSLKTLISHALLEVELSAAMKLKLNIALDQANRLISRLSAGGQISYHLINKEWGYAGSELAVFLAATAITAGVAVYSVPAAIAVGVIGSFIGFPELEEYLDEQFRAWNSEGISRLQTVSTSSFDIIDFLLEANKVFKLPSIYNGDPNTDFCENLPPYKREQIEECSMMPIIIDLDSNGVDFLPIKDSKVYFDINSDGILDHVSWPTKGNGVLFADWNGNGLDRPEEFIFSTYSPYKKANDLEGFSLFDYDNNGVINKEDKIYNKLYIWDDLNSDGTPDFSEITPVNEIIKEFNLHRNIHYFKNKKVNNNKIDVEFLSVDYSDKPIKSYSVTMKYKKG